MTDGAIRIDALDKAAGCALDRAPLVFGYFEQDASQHHFGREGLGLKINESALFRLVQSISPVGSARS